MQRAHGRHQRHAGALAAQLGEGAAERGKGAGDDGSTGRQGAPTAWTATGPLRVGTALVDSSSTGTAWPGTVDDVMTWRRALSPAEAEDVDTLTKLYLEAESIVKRCVKACEP